jgi:hypothetical protein
MAYSPQINVVDATQFKDNLIAHFQANQADALIWANGGRILQEIRNFYKSPRLVTVFPALTFIQISHESKYENILEIDLSVLIEVAIIHGNKDTLSDRSLKYSMAIESMLANVPETTLNQNSIIEIESTNMGLKTTFDVQAKFKTQYIEVFQTLANWHIEASAFSS